MPLIALFLAWTNLAFAEPPREVKLCPKYFASDNIPPIDQDAVLVQRGSGELSVDQHFQRTHRTLEEIRQLYGGYLSPDFIRGKLVVDVACGGGTFVRQLRAEHPANRVIGVDLYLDDSQKAQPDLFVQGDGLALPWPDGSVDILVETQGPLEYYGYDTEAQETLWWLSFSESLRVLSPTGVFLTASFPEYVKERILLLQNALDIGILADGIYAISRK